MNWLSNLFKVKENEVCTGTSELNNRIIEIQGRIAALRSSLGGTEKSNQNITPTQQLPQASGVHTPDTSGYNERTTKEAEMMALKAKLLGKKL